MIKNKKELLLQTKKGAYRTNIWYDKRDKAYLVKVPGLPEVVTFGKTFAEAKKMARDAIELYCECVIDQGNVVVDDQRQVIGKKHLHSRILAPVA